MPLLLPSRGFFLENVPIYDFGFTISDFDIQPIIKLKTPVSHYPWGVRFLHFASD